MEQPQETAAPQPAAAEQEQPVESGLIALAGDDLPVERIVVQDVPEVPADWRKLHPEQRVKLARLLPGDFVVHDGETVEDAADRVLKDFAAQPAPKPAEDVTAAVTEQPPAKQVEQPLISPEQLAKLQQEASRENDKQDFIKRVMEARKPDPKYTPAAPGPVAPRIVEQTNAEMMAGQALVAKNAELQAKRVPPPPDKSEGRTVEVLRPPEFREYKNSFKSPGQTPDKAGASQGSPRAG